VAYRGPAANYCSLPLKPDNLNWNFLV